MRLGPLEIGIIIAVILVILVVTQIRQHGKNAATEDDTSARVGKRKDKEKAKQRRHPYLRATGITFVLLGIIFLLVNLNMLKWAFWANTWSFIIMAIGLAAIFMSRRK